MYDIHAFNIFTFGEVRFLYISFWVRLSIILKISHFLKRASNKHLNFIVGKNYFICIFSIYFPI